MGLLDSFSKLLGKDSYQESNYLSLVLTPDRVAALIWTLENGQVRELGFGQKPSTSLDLILHQAAVAIDTAGQEAKVDFTRTVFGISSNWLENGELSGKSTKIFKKLAAELELAPQAFVPIAAAINHFLKVEKFPAPQVIAIGLFATRLKQPFCEIHLIDKNKVAATVATDLPPTLEKVKEQIKQLAPGRQLPPRVIIYGIDQEDKLARQIESADWEDYFIQEPKFDFLSDRELARAVAYAQAADLLGHEPQAKVRTTLPPAQLMVPPKITNELGFIEGEDILEAPKSEPQAPEQSETDQPKEQPLAIGAEGLFQESENHGFQAVDEAMESISMRNKIPRPLGRGSLFSKLMEAQIFSPLPKKLALTVLGFLITAALGTFVTGQFLTKAEVIIKVQGQEHQDNFQATVKSGVDFDSAKSQIPGQIITAAALGNQKAVTTGDKKIGEKSRGEVSVLNWTRATKKFPEGTAIISKNGFKFTLDSDVEVASRSAEIPGKNKVVATAAEVGESSNLSQGIEFTFVAFDEISYSAQAETSFSGGSARQVTVVTRQDMGRLEKSLTETTISKAREDIKNKAAGRLLLDDAISIKITRKNFDKKEDEEASLLTLDMEVEATAIIFDENDLKKLLAETTNSGTDAELVARPENLEIKNIKAKREENALTLTGDYDARLVPRFDESGLKDQIAGKSEKAARQTVLQISGVTDVQIVYSPNLPLVGSLPRNKKNLKIKIETI
ncbi:MAG: hypothetical protein AAB639_01365 [Patescibacteria group bacterium]